MSQMQKELFTETVRMSTESQPICDNIAKSERKKINMRMGKKNVMVFAVFSYSALLSKTYIAELLHLPCLRIWNFLRAAHCRSGTNT